jgi:uncharacterized membrane protein
MPKPLMTPYVTKMAGRVFIREEAAKPQNNKTAEIKIVKPGDFLPVIKPPAIPPRQKNIIEIVKIRDVCARVHPKSFSSGAINKDQA